MTRAIMALACFPLALPLAPADVTRLNAGEALVEVLPAARSSIRGASENRRTADMYGPACRRSTRRVRANPRARDALVARKQVYASHYITASLSLTAIGSARDGDARYLIYINYTRADVFDGSFGGFIRRMVEKRVRAEGPRSLEHPRVVSRVRVRLERARAREEGTHGDGNSC